MPIDARSRRWSTWKTNGGSMEVTENSKCDDRGAYVGLLRILFRRYRKPPDLTENLRVLFDQRSKAERLLRRGFEPDTDDTGDVEALTFRLRRKA
jgi:hypothetical protein